MFSFPPAHCCRHCNAAALRWVEPSGRGSVYSVALPLGLEAAQRDAPRLALIELEEGPRIAGRVMDVEPAELLPGLPVSAHIALIGGAMTLVFYNKEQGSREW